MTKQKRHLETARKFERWLEKHPNASLAHKCRKFNQICDKVYEGSRQNRVRKAVPRI